MKHTDDRPSIEDILTAHADALARGQAGPAAWLEDVDNGEVLRSLLSVAELVQEALVPVQPKPAFMRRLGQQLLSSSRQGRKILTARARRAALVGAAALGSLVSVASAIGLVVYILRHRVRA
ncbi:MAG: hypothetical protein JW850_04925 [Thermoflexales bacterium]|nr:hypothetical protein [Thermoflexales bacterium]